MVDENKKKMVDESKTKFIISNISVIIANKEQCDKLYDMLEEGIIEDDSNFEYD